MYRGTGFEIAIQLRVEEEHDTDVARVAPHDEPSFAYAVVSTFVPDPAEHIRVVVNSVERDPVALNGTLGIRQEIEPERCRSGIGCCRLRAACSYRRRGDMPRSL